MIQKSIDKNTKFSEEIHPYTEYNYMNSSKMINVNLRSLQNINRSMQPIKRYEAEIGGLRGKERYVKPSIYHPFDGHENTFVDDSSTSLWVSLLLNELTGISRSTKVLKREKYNKLSAFLLINIKIVISSKVFTCEIAGKMISLQIHKWSSLI